MTTHRSDPLPREFLWRRLHSLMGVMLVIFLIEHLLTNSEAALWVGEDGQGFVRMVNFIHSLPYLPVIEMALIGIPLFIHIVWGVQYLRTAEPNSLPGDGKRVALPSYARNHLYTLQRLTSWLLIIGVLAHVVHMRFGSYPTEAHYKGEKLYLVNLDLDEGLYTVAARLGVSLYDQKAIAQEAMALAALDPLSHAPEEQKNSQGIDNARATHLIAEQQRAEHVFWVRTLQAEAPKPNEVIAAASTIGTAWLLVVRDTFKIPLMLGLYSLFVVTATFHAFNGLWTFCVSWGVTLTARSQQLMRTVCVTLMLAVTALGLAAIWGTYYFNLYS